MSLYIDEDDASHELRVPYCGCDSPGVERLGSPSTLYCILCDRRYPDEETIYGALRNLKSVGVLGRRRFKKTKYRIEKIEAVVAEAQDQPSIKPLIDLYGKNIFSTVVKRLWMEGRFRSDYTAQNLDWDIPAPNAETEYMSEKPAEDTPEKSDWELLVPADVTEKASPCVLEEEAPDREGPVEEAPAKYECSPEGELPTAKAHPMEEHDEDLLAEAKSTEGM